MDSLSKLPTSNSGHTPNAKWYQVYGFHPKALLEIITEHWIWSLIVVIATVLSIIVVFL